MMIDRLDPPASYWDRRAHVAALAAGADQNPIDVDYTLDEDATWAAVCDALAPLWDRHAAAAVIGARDRLLLPRTRVPQLREVGERLDPMTGFRFEAMPGLVAKEEFFGALARGRFLSTQYVRWEGSPLYTPEPDVIHEVIGHAHALADDRLAALHRLAGEAMLRVEEPASRQFVADVFWFSGEFGVVREAGGWRAYGAGLLSSVGELAWFADHALVLPLDIAAMGTTPYEISRYQPVLFGAGDLDEVLDTVGGFFARCTDRSISQLRSRPVETHR